MSNAKLFKGQKGINCFTQKLRIRFLMQKIRDGYLDFRQVRNTDLCRDQHLWRQWPSATTLMKCQRNRSCQTPRTDTYQRDQ